MRTSRTRATFIGRFSYRDPSIIDDNVVRGGAVIGPKSTGLNAEGVRTILEIIVAEARLTATRKSDDWRRQVGTGL